MIKDCDQNFKNYFVLYRGHLVYTTINYETTSFLQRYYYDLSSDISSDSESFIEKFKDPILLQNDGRTGADSVSYGYANRGAEGKGV